MKNQYGKLNNPVDDVVIDDFAAVVMAVPDGEGGGRPDGTGGGMPPWTGGGGGGGGGKPPNAGSKKGELFGDQIVILRDLDPRDGTDDGEPLLDENGQLIVIGYDPEGFIRPNDDDGLFPIYFELVPGEEDDYEIPATFLPYVQEVELERANVARAPSRVMEKALLAALDKLESAYATDPDNPENVIRTDPAGRLMYSFDGGLTFGTIDAPLENLAIYQMMMSQDSSVGGWSQALVDSWSDLFAHLVGDDIKAPEWDPSALIGAAWSKEGKITLDALIYENTTLGVNVVTGSGEGLTIDYFDFHDDIGETFDYSRSDRYDDTWLKWISEDGGLHYEYATVYDAVFGEVEWGNAEDLRLVVDDMGTMDPLDDDFVYEPALMSGVNDFAQAADDSRAVINFIHTYGAVEIDASEVPSEFMADAIA